MKKMNHLALFMVFGLCSIFSMGVVKAADYMLIKEDNIVCNPSQITNGEETKCYIIVQADTSSSDNPANASLHGIVTHAFTTRDLEIISAEPNRDISGLEVAFTNRPSTGTGTEKLTGVEIPDEVANYKCDASGIDEWMAAAKTGGAIHSDGPHKTYACAVFYTKKNETKNAIYDSKLSAGNTKYSDNILKSFPLYSVIGNYVVKMPADTTDKTGACGEICVKSWGIEALNGYATWPASSKDSPRSTACVEIGRKPTSENPNPGHTPETGAFTSYMVLVAGALIAIGAIAIAKKNNRFSKI